eukprot:GHUV01023099.1.p1 GENE.GHUV01023099.1~~GHUV01023099.1.p1  ORF type:complete len:271 (+),score=40.39 GHUV01023099.1:60-815(+)
MCPFASLLRELSGTDPSAATGCPVASRSARMNQHQPMNDSKEQAHGSSNGGFCPWQQAMGNRSMAPALPHSTSSDSLVDEPDTFVMPGLSASSSNSTFSEHLSFTTDCSHSSSTADVPQPATTSYPDSSSNNDSYTFSTHQHWKIQRPQLAHDPKLTRRQLRRLGRSWTLADVAQHKYCDGGWIAVDGRIYDITEHIVNHPGWDSGCQVTTVLSILAHLGTDCSEEFREIHRPYPVAWKQLQAYYIGDLAQ